MEKFVYKKSAGITALSATFADFKYKKHCHEEYALGVTYVAFNSITWMEVYSYPNQEHKDKALPSSMDNYAAPIDKVRLFMSLFKGREDVYAKRWESKKRE